MSLFLLKCLWVKCHPYVCNSGGPGGKTVCIIDMEIESICGKTSTLLNLGWGVERVLIVLSTFQYVSKFSKHKIRIKSSLKKVLFFFNHSRALCCHMHFFKLRWQVHVKHRSAIGTDTEMKSDVSD